MASLRFQGLRSVFRGQCNPLRTQQRRWAQVHDVRFLASHHNPNHVLDRYRSKLDQKAKQEGHESIDSLKEAFSDKIQDLRSKASTVTTPEPEAPIHNTTQEPAAAKAPISHAAREVSGKASPIKPLSSFLDVEKIRELPPKEIEALWRLRFASSSTSICAAIPLEIYQRIMNAARQNPQFVLPLPRGATEDQQETTADIHFLQWAFHPPAGEPAAPSGETANTHISTVIFTHLGAFKMHGSFAQPHTTITHYLDLADDKGLVLMHGQVVPDRGVSTMEATWLASCVQRFYDFEGQASGRKSELVRMFTQGDAENFKVEELMAEAEKLQ
ncbi:hypothetical protein N7520_006044 [Penicillium odoratum]|uniref:uncharacterized protein n=1 Tax=Penicillium odoratum TaxID=1167516 RepID=UPI0025487AFA|nr:uncharacterized protein N7520_006044 [Penicillium odoratum]KAJ5758888.1 hypothetical protein N7520_006044 [Penicillium odoratum]